SASRARSPWSPRCSSWTSPRPPRSTRDREDRGADPRAERALYDRHRDPQHAAGGPGLGHDRVLLSRPAGRVRSDGPDLHESLEAGDRGLHHGTLRLRSRPWRYTRTAGTKRSWLASASSSWRWGASSSVRSATR